MRILSYSSLATSQLVLYNNPDGLEKNWFSIKLSRDRPIHQEDTDLYDIDFQQKRPPDPVNLPIDLQKKVVVQACSLLLCAAASVESVAYAALAIATFFTDPFTGVALHKRYVALFSSSSFTIVWNIAGHLFCRNAPVEESFARLNFKKFHYLTFFGLSALVLLIYARGTILLGRSPYSEGTQAFGKAALSFCLAKTYSSSADFPEVSNEDVDFIEDWIEDNKEQLEVRSAVFPFKKEGNEIEGGADLLKEMIFKPGCIDKDTLDEVKCGEIESFPFMGARVVYPYLFGDKKSERIPSFFNYESRICIKEARREFKADSGTNLFPFLYSIESYTNATWDNAKEKKMWKKLKAIGYQTHQGGDLFQKSLVIALSRHQNEEPTFFQKISGLFKMIVELFP